MDAKERAKTKKKIEDPVSWPCWPCLPMKRTVDGQVEAGFSVTPDYPTIVLKGFPSAEGIILQLACEQGVPVPGSKELQHADVKAKEFYEERVVKRYEDIDGMLDDGWRID